MVKGIENALFKYIFDKFNLQVLIVRIMRNILTGHGMGPKGYCICLKCGYRMPKQRGVRCMDIHCPKCGSVMVREGSYHHQLFLEKKKKL